MIFWPLHDWDQRWADQIHPAMMEAKAHL